VTGAELDRSVRAELKGLHGSVAKEVSRHLVMAGRLLDEDPEAAYRHAAVARDRAPRVASVREAAGLAAYSTDRFAEALAELRTVRRLTGSQEHLPVMADCERGLGRPERALALAQSAEAQRLGAAGKIEMLIVAAGARADLGELDAAVVTLEVPLLQSAAQEPWVARLRSAYADALEAAGRPGEARVWLERAAGADTDGSTGAAERLAELDGTVLLDLEEDDLGDADEDSDEDGGLDPGPQDAGPDPAQAAAGE
jgi:tetratricopeptide (TPR) repeat protein